MKKTLFYFLAFMLLFLMVSCKDNSQKKKEVQKETVEKDSIVETEIDEATKEYEPGEDDIREYGRIEHVEDATYPFFEVTFNFVERNMKQDFNLNIESISLTDTELYNLKGKYATLYYTSDLVNDLVDLHHDGKSLFGEYAPDMNSNWKKITGIMSGATSLSGDLPGKIQVTDSDGKKMEFELYIEDTTMAANGKMVTAYYTLHGVNTVTHIEPSKE